MWYLVIYMSYVLQGLTYPFPRPPYFIARPPKTPRQRTRDLWVVPDVSCSKARRTVVFFDEFQVSFEICFRIRKNSSNERITLFFHTALPLFNEFFFKIVYEFQTIAKFIKTTMVASRRVGLNTKSTRAARFFPFFTCGAANTTRRDERRISDTCFYG